MSLTSHHEEASVIEFVSQLISEAIDKQASDIHIEPIADQYRIRFRCQGMLSHISTITTPFALRVLTRIKIMSQLNIAERRLPQDGRIHNMRVSTCPTLYNEKMVLRLLNNSNDLPNIQHLGLDTQALQILKHYLTQPQGLILVTGPTGSGKTLTLYAALNYLNTVERNIATVEDPIEIELPGVNQVNINPPIGLSFSSILKNLLRQDPDILMIGEIRDAETAAIAIQAAQTGHLVLSTLHTNHAADAIVRLQSLGVPAYQLKNSLSLIISQRLVRKLCIHCKQADTINDCDYCQQGYSGRTGVFELFEKTIPLKEAGVQLVLNGTTSLTEIERVLGA